MEENKQIIYLNKAGESWITDRFRHEWYEHNKNTTRYLKDQILFGSFHRGLGIN